MNKTSEVILILVIYTNTFLLKEIIWARAENKPAKYMQKISQQNTSKYTVLIWASGCILRMNWL